MGESTPADRLAREGETAEACSLLVDVIYQRSKGNRDWRLGNSDEDLLGALEAAADEIAATMKAHRGC